MLKRFLSALARMHVETLHIHICYVWRQRGAHELCENVSLSVTRSWSQWVSFQSREQRAARINKSLALHCAELPGCNELVANLTAAVAVLLDLHQIKLAPIHPASRPCRPNNQPPPTAPVLCRLTGGRPAPLAAAQKCNKIKCFYVKTLWLCVYARYTLNAATLSRPSTAHCASPCHALAPLCAFVMSSASSSTLLDFSLACFSFSSLSVAAAAVITAASHVLTVINLTGENEIYMANNTYWPALCRCNLSKCCTARAVR